MRIITSLLLLSLICSVQSSAQIVNIENARMQSDTTGWMGGAGAGFSIQKYTTQILSVNLEAHLQYKTKKDLWLLLADNVFLKSGDQKLLNNSFAHLRYNRKINSWLRWEAFTQIQSNLITQIKSRFLIGTGPRFKLFANKKFKLYAATLAMYENERENTDPPVTHNDLRNSSYITFTYLPADNIELTSTTFFQPLFKNVNDNRLFNQAVCRVRATKRFGLYIKWNYLHDTRPAGTAPKTNYTFISGFGLSF